MPMPSRRPPPLTCAPAYADLLPCPHAEAEALDHWGQLRTVAHNQLHNLGARERKVNNTGGETAAEGWR
jgi:hypothetical protein